MDSKKFIFIERKTNYGLAKNITEGVSDIINMYGKIIVMEDDLVVAENFLDFMNDALDFYQNETKVWNITAHQLPIDTSKFKKISTTFSRQMGCWTWGTWKDRWEHYEKNPQKLIDTFTKKEIYEFDFHPPDSRSLNWSQVLSNQEGLTNTWAIFWYATIFKKRGLCLEPIQSFVQNTGFDELGTHTSQKNSLHFMHNQLPKIENWKFSKKIKENKKLFKEKRKLFYPELKIEPKINKNILFLKDKMDYLTYKVKFYSQRLKQKSIKEKLKSVLKVMFKIMKP